MSHWFDRLSMRASGDDSVIWASEGQLVPRESERASRGSITRRDALKAAAVGTAAVGALASPSIARASEGFGVTARRKSPCACHRDADKNFDDQVDRLEEITGINNPFNSLMSGLSISVYVAGGAGALFGLGLQKVACGRCKGNPSGNLDPAPPGFNPGAGGGQSPNDCPPNTSRCTGILCCYGNDLCCRCNTGDVTCCIAAIGCTCC